MEGNARESGQAEVARTAWCYSQRAEANGHRSGSSRHSCFATCNAVAAAAAASAARTTGRRRRRAPLKLRDV